ncbi:transglutaminase-like domain-containing protein, partial [Desulfatitalea alkaliphila]
MQKATHTITMEALRKGLFARLAGMLTLIIFGFVFYIAPTGEAIAEVMSRDDQPSSELEAILESTPDKKLGHRLSRLRETIVNDLPRAMEQRRDLRGWLDRARERIMPADPLTASETKDLRRLGERIADAYHEAHEKFVEDARRWEQTDLAPHVRRLIRERHQEAMARFQSRHDALRRHLQTLVESKGETQRKAFDDLRTELEETPFERRHTPLDPNQLPWGPSDSQVREPITNPEEFKEILGILPRTAYPLVAANQLPIGLLSGTTLAAAPPVDADLAQTLEVRFTDEIQDLAADLDNDPTQIHAWVHNHIRYIPSHGSIQGAQATLEGRSGNAMDTAGLLISLLRAAGIPSRYAYGTVEAPAEKVMNWVGGAHTPEAAMNLMAQGGIPVTGITQGGQITHIRFEHVWAQAWVDYFPGRGMTHQTGDSWIPMDA